MRRSGSDDQRGGPSTAPAVSAATREDLALAVQALAEAERQRAVAVGALTRVRARGDGEAAVGMPVAQHLRWSTNLRHGTVTTLSTIVDVAAELPTVMAAHACGRINLDQLAAVAWPAARVSTSMRRSLDLSLEGADGWTDLSPDGLEVEVTRLLEDLAPAPTETQELERAQHQYLHLQSTLDGQGLQFWGQAWGLDAAAIDATLRAAADIPEATGPDPDGILAGQPTVRDRQLLTGLLRICHAYRGAQTDSSPDVTIYAIVDETAVAAGSGEVLTARRGLAPRLSAATVRRLQAEGARRVEVFAVDREIVAVNGRAGHSIDDPAGLSDDTTRIIVTVRDRTCRMPGCDRPVEHLHHLIHRGRPASTDDPGNLAGLCLACHQLVHRWRWSGTVGRVGRLTWTRSGSTVATIGRMAQRLPRPPPRETTLDHFGDPLPF